MGSTFECGYCFLVCDIVDVDGVDDHTVLNQSCNKNSSKIWGEGLCYWVPDFIATYMALFKLVLGGLLDTGSRPNVVDD